MDITEVRVKLMNDKTEKLQAFCSITISNDFVIRDLKIIEGASGPFVAMPSRKLAEKCPKCGCKNHLRANYCSECGGRLKNERANRDDRGRTKLHADIAHPINSVCREELQKRVLAAYQEEVKRSQQEGYVPANYDEETEEVAAIPENAAAQPAQRPPDPPQQRESRPQQERHEQQRQPERAEQRDQQRPPERHERREQREPQRPQYNQPPRPQNPPPRRPADEDVVEQPHAEENLDEMLDSPLDDFKQEKKRRDDSNDDFGSGIFT